LFPFGALCCFITFIPAIKTGTVVSPVVITVAAVTASKRLALEWTFCATFPAVNASKWFTFRALIRPFATVTAIKTGTVAFAWSCWPVVPIEGLTLRTVTIPTIIAWSAITVKWLAWSVWSVARRIGAVPITVTVAWAFITIPVEGFAWAVRPVVPVPVAICWAVRSAVTATFPIEWLAITISWTI
jgi:hypothetical protein